ncbi:MAG TPA: hypothetical protein VKG45_04530 [Actinomycetes bacterium]|nr:hypothetical protein [Actinomycetes bacterium]
MLPTSCVSHLRVYQPLAAFPARQRARWAAYVESGESPPAHQLVEREARDALLRVLGRTPVVVEHAFVERRGRNVYVCPQNTELRVLEALLSFRRSASDAVVEAFVPARDLEWAARVIRRLRLEDEPGPRAYVQQSAWTVPLTWFALFDDGERTVSPATARQPSRLVYTTGMPQARTRISRALKALAELADEPDVARAAGELRDWLYEFDRDSLVILDYGGIAQTIPFGDLVDDHSAREVGEAIAALEEGDLERAGELYAVLGEHWSALRGMASRN